MCIARPDIVEPQSCVLCVGSGAVCKPEMFDHMHNVRL